MDRFGRRPWDDPELLGHGVGLGHRAFRFLYSILPLTGKYPFHSHNTHLQVAVETGSSGWRSPTWEHLEGAMDFCGKPSL